MIFELITPPAIEPFTVDDLKDAMRIDHDDDDALVVQLGEVARRQIERRLSHAVAQQTWRVTVGGCSIGPLTLRPGLVRSVDAVSATYEDQSVLSVDDYTFVRGRPSKISFSPPRANNGHTLESVSVTFTAGRSDVATTPPDLVHAITMLAAHYYENREAVGEGRYVAMPSGVETILNSLREVNL